MITSPGREIRARRALLPLLVAAVCLLASPLLCLAGPPVNILDQDAWTPIQNGPADVAIAPLRADQLPPGVTSGLDISVQRPTPGSPWMEEISQPLLPALGSGAQFRLTFWARSATGNPVHAVLIDSSPPYTAAFSQRFSLTPEWQEYTVDGVSPGYPAGGSALQFQYGDQAGEFDFAGITLQASPLPPEFVADKEATGDSQIRARIRRYRMAELTVTVCDQHGHPLAGARVHVAQTRHAFLFGCNAMLLNPADTSPWQLEYQQRLSALFNFAPVGFFWNGFEPTEGHPNYAYFDSQVDWLRAHGMECEGTPLVWQQSYPDWAPEDPDQTISLLHDRVTDLIQHYRGRVESWIVINETNAASQFHNGLGNWARRDGKEKVVATALGWARAAGAGEPETFIYNDYDIGEDNLALLSSLAAAGSLPDAIGIQSHMHQGVWPMVSLWETCRRFAVFGRPLYFTETTVLSGPSRKNIDYLGPPATDWQDTPAGEAFQAEYVRRFYSVLFSEPDVRAINWWDLSDRGAWLGAPAGLLRADMTPKPAYTELLALIRHTWWTDAQGKTDSRGRYGVHAFYGDYTITATDTHGHARTRTIQWPEGSGPRTVTLALTR